jgi:hypothetical protein
MGQGVAAFSGLGLSGLADMPRVLRKETRVLGQDLLETCEFDT